MSRYIFVIEADRCIGCKGCMVACKMENEVALGANRNKVYDVGPMGVFPDLEMYFLPVMCQQCENPSCVAVCPTNACHINEADKVILIDQDKCISCHACEKACPYQINTFNKELRVMDKCTICSQRREVGDVPHCVKNCSGRALHYGDIEDPNSEVSQILKNEKPEHIHKLPDMGNHPSNYYILRKGTWQDALPQTFAERRNGKGGK